MSHRVGSPTVVEDSRFYLCDLHAFDGEDVLSNLVGLAVPLSGDRTRAHLTWKLSVEAVDDSRTSYTNSVIAYATTDLLRYLDDLAFPFADAAAARRCATADQIRRETPGFAVSIARHALGR